MINNIINLFYEFLYNYFDKPEKRRLSEISEVEFAKLIDMIESGKLEEAKEYCEISNISTITLDNISTMVWWGWNIDT